MLRPNPTDSKIGELGTILVRFAFTYLSHHNELLVQLPMDATTPDRVEWLIDGKWLNRAQASSLDPSKLKHFRLAFVNAIAYYKPDVRPGDQYRGVAPLNPYTVVQEVASGCANDDTELPATTDVYW